MKFLLLLVLALAAVNAEVFFEETFPSESWKKEWVYSKHSGKEFGEFEWTHGKFYNDETKDKGIQTSKDARFYGLSRKFTPFTNKDKDLVFQFSVKHEQNIDCGGGYMKLFDCSLKPEELHGDTPYLMMFGPDICGHGTKKVHVIFNYKNKNMLIKKNISCKDDVYTHLYTLVVKPDNTYEVYIDNEKVESGSLEEDWDFLPPKKVKDPSKSKPADWDDKEMMPDPDDTKPEDWDQPMTIPDPEAKKPEDWDDEMDGEWEPPSVDNPSYKGEWKPKEIKNPNYKGEWIHPEIDNPEYTPDAELYKYDEICGVGFDVWQVKSGTIFDNILLTNDLEYAQKIGEELAKTREGEKKMKEEQDEEERKQREKESKDSGEEKEPEPEEDEEEEADTTTPEVEEHDEL